MSYLPPHAHALWWYLKSVALLKWGVTDVLADFGLHVFTIASLMPKVSALISLVGVVQILKDTATLDSKLCIFISEISQNWVSWTIAVEVALLEQSC